MLNRTSTTVIVRTLLLAGILLATLLVTSQSFFPAFAQETLETERIDFNENSEDSVAVYTATDPEEEDIEWSLEGTDEGYFSVDGGVLTFKTSPNFECPKQDDQGNCHADQTNTYNVTVVAQAGTGGESTTTKQPVEITVMNVEESGNLNLMTLQPKKDVPISPTLTDDDGQSSDNRNKDLVDVAEWQWATSTSETGPWNDINPSQDSSAGPDVTNFDGNDESYKPRKSDVGLYLRVTATYVDGSGENDPFTDEVDESKDTISMVFANPVVASDYVNARPKFRDRDPNTDGNQPDVMIEVKEDLKSGSNIGDRIEASDKGADGNEETLRYVLEDESGADRGSDYVFVIDSATGQISLGADKKLDFDDDDRQYVVYVQAYDPSSLPAEVEDRAKVTIGILNVDEAPAMEAADTADSDGLSAKSLAEFDSDTPGTTYDRSISTYTASDPEDDRNLTHNLLEWSLGSGGDSARFELIRVADSFAVDTTDNTDDCERASDNEGSFTTDGKVLLCLKDPADYEARDLSGNYIYDVTVTVTDSDGMKVSRDVDVTITNVEETGWMTLPHVQPEIGTLFKAEHFDPDGKRSVKSWQWATSTSPSGTWNDIDTSAAKTANYTPRESDFNSNTDTYLRVTVKYTDRCGNETPGCGDDELIKVSAEPVQAEGRNNADPVFVDQSSQTITAVEWAIDEEQASPITLDDKVGDVNYFQATDADDSNLTLSLTGLTGSESGKFAIVRRGTTNPIGVDEAGDVVTASSQYQLIVRESLDYEADTSHSFSIKAKDASGDEGTLSVTVTVKQVDEDPAFTSKEDSFSYEEDSTGRVATFAARDPENGTTLTWSLSGSDKDDFSIASNGALTFDDSPDYETPTDRADVAGTPDAESNDNVYEVVVQATDRTNNTMGLAVKVTVTNKEEDGTVTLSTGQPKITLDDAAMITATLIDPDGKVNDTLPLESGDTNLTGQYDVTTAATTEWQWATSTAATGPWNDVEGEAGTTSSYTLGESDAGLYLRATAVYSDGHGVDDGDTKADESKDMALVVSARVLMADYENKEPMFPDQEPDITGVQNATTTRKVFENATPGTLVGDPIAFMDEGGDGTQETLFYTLRDATPAPDDDIDDVEFFVIDSSTGQIRLSNAAADAKLNYESLDYNPPGDNGPGNRPDYQYELIVEATDPSNAASSTKVSIKVLNVNEAPKLEKATESVNVAATTTPEIDSDEPTADYERMVSTYEAMDDEDDNASLEWSLSGPDSEKFEFSPSSETVCDTTDTSVRTAKAARVLVCFDSEFAPDFESPTDSNGDNVYNVTVEVTDRDRNSDSRDVAVTVTNVEENGKVVLKNLVPEVGIPITAVLTDLDGGIRDVEWQWSYAEDDEVIDGATSATYTPVTGDFDPVPQILRATATYRDAAKKDNPFTAMDESKITLPGDSENPVKDADPQQQGPRVP